MCDSTQGSLCPTPMVIPGTSKYVDTVTIYLKNLNQKVNDPKMTFDPTSVEVTHVTSTEVGSKVNDPKMTFDPTSVEVTCVTLPKDHCVQVPWEYIYVRYVDTVSGQFCKFPYTYRYLHVLD